MDDGQAHSKVTELWFVVEGTQAAQVVRTSVAYPHWISACEEPCEGYAILARNDFN